MIAAPYIATRRTPSAIALTPLSASAQVQALHLNSQIMLARPPVLAPARLPSCRRHRCLSSRRPGVCRSALDPGLVDVATSTLDSQYVPSELVVEEWQIWVGAVAGFSPFVIAAYEFGKRILIQRQCALCSGSGLIQRGKYLRKCTACGGFLPWQSWQRFFESSPGNGSVVRYPKGQTSVFFSVDQATAVSQDMAVSRAEFEQQQQDLKSAASASTTETAVATGPASASAVETRPVSEESGQRGKSRS